MDQGCKDLEEWKVHDSWVHVLDKEIVIVVEMEAGT